MKASYTHDEVLVLLVQAVEQAEQHIYAGLRGADNETRLNSLDQLDALELVEQMVKTILNRDGETHGE